MKMFVEPERIYLHRDAVDFRKSIDGLVAIVEGELERDAYTGALFCFATKRKINSSWFTGIKRGLLCGISDSKNKSSNGQIKPLCKNLSSVLGNWIGCCRDMICLVMKSCSINL